MDGIVALVLAAVYCFVYRAPKRRDVVAAISSDRITPNVALNPEMLHDEHAFMEIANELGFH